MKKRLFCLALCMVLLLSVALTGCGKKETLEEKLQQQATTLSMWVVTENPEGVDEETARIVSDAINAITNANFKVRLVINYLTEDEYRAKLDRTIRDYIDVRATQPVRSITSDSTETVAEAETEVNEWGFTVIKYPDLLENQVDIVYIQGEDMYLEYIKNGWLTALDNELTGSSKKIKEYVNSALLAAAKRSGGTYAIPNNHTIGKYTVMLLNKELMKETDYDAIYKQGKINGLFNSYVYSYLEDMRNKKVSHGGTDVVPIAAKYEDCLNLLAHFWNIDPDTLENREALSVLGYYYTNPASTARSTALRFDSLFTNENFTNAFVKLKEFQMDGNYFGTETEGSRVAMKLSEMDYSEYVTYLADSSEYYPVIVKNPTVKAEDVYGSMFGVCAKTMSVSHSMEIITLLNTNAEFRNLLQYGVEGKTYSLETDPNDYNLRTVELLPEHPYKMDVFKTGNAFIAYPEPGMDPAIWENGREQNLAVVGADPLLDVSFRSIAEGSVKAEAAPTATAGNVIYDYKGGLSREVLSQNSALKEWLAKCDEQGKGVYLLQTTETVSQNTTSFCYYYNNRAAATATANYADGAMTVSYNEGGAGYELGLLSVYSRKNTEFRLAAALNGAETEVRITKRYSLIPLDLLHTNTYNVRVSTGIAKTSVDTNEVIWNWITGDCASAAAGVPNVLASTKTLANGNTKYTYLVYTAGVGENYTVNAKPTGSDTNVTVDLQFNGTVGGSGYALWLVTVETDPTVTQVAFDLSFNGSKVTPAVTTAATDPSFTYCGTLDSELVRYLDEVNTALVARIDACVDVNELKEVIAEMKILLTPHSGLNHIAPASTYVMLADFVADHDLETLNYALLCATSTASVAHKALEVDENDQVKTVDVKRDAVAGEDYVLLDSPFKLYNTWLQNNGYISKR